jgi:hypothetical protein
MFNPVARANVAIMQKTKRLRCFRLMLKVSERLTSFAGSDGNSFAITMTKQKERRVVAMARVEIVIASLGNHVSKIL